jgi:hypothetical protein
MAYGIDENTDPRDLPPITALFTVPSVLSVVNLLLCALCGSAVTCLPR